MGAFVIPAGGGAAPEDPGPTPETGETAPAPILDDLVFVGFNARVFAIDRYDGTIRWRFKVPDGSGFVALLLDGDRLVASSNGYTHGLDPWRGTVLWSQPFKGEGVGIPSLCSVRGSSNQAAAAASQAAADAQKRSTTTHVHTGLHL